LQASQEVAREKVAEHRHGSQHATLIGEDE
jgi:hypothetical protein